jgi:tetratricopeptide (TPR) repeat protein
LRPAPAFVNSNPTRPATERPVDLAQLKPGTAGATGESSDSSGKASPPGLPATAASGGGVLPAEPSRVESSAGVPAAALPDRPAKPRQPEPAKAAAPKVAAKARDTAATAGAAQTGDSSRALNVNRAATRIHPRVQSGYASYQAGDLSSAHAEYRQALREEPGNRDALLGLAAVETRAQRYEQAEAYYQRLLEADPRDPHAHAGMLALRGQRIDPVQAESRIKTILAADPDANVLYFTLGNQYAQQGRWAEAHQAYAKALAADSENPDFAFNLAVSLDQLRQPGPALEYYRRALELAGKRAAHFAPEAVRQRVQQLSR